MFKSFFTPSVAYRLLALNLVYFVIVLLALAAMLFVPLIVNLESPWLSWLEKGEVAGRFLWLHTRIWLTIFILLAVLTIHSLITARKVSRSLDRFRSVLHAIGEGDLGVRATNQINDYLIEEADTINQMIESLRKKIAHVQEHATDTSHAATDLAAAIRSGSTNETKEVMRRLEIHLEQLKKRVEQIRILPEKSSPEP